ncbi:MAG: IS21 family transposase [Nocardioides sp.]
MEERKKGRTQATAAARAGFCERSARNLKKPKKGRDWKTRPDPFEEVWEGELCPLLETNPALQPITLLEEIQKRYPGEYPDSTLRTLQRRVRRWKALHGEEKEVIFRQEHPPGGQGLSDFTCANGLRVTIGGDPLDHRFYHFRLAYSGWEHAQVILGGESFTALAEGLQNGLWDLGGAPKTHRTDSLSAAYQNGKEEFTRDYEELCGYYGMKPTRNNKGVSHENGTIEASHGHLKRRVEQALLLRGSRDFLSLEEYRDFVRQIIQRHNLRVEKLVMEERPLLIELPMAKTADYTEERVRVTSSSTITVRGAIYSVHSRLIGMILKVHLYDDRLECFVGGDPVITLSRVRKGDRAINYRHLIGSLSRKPGAFRNYIFRDELFPTLAFRQSWEELDHRLEDRVACREYVALLKEAADRQEAVNAYLESCLADGRLPTAKGLPKSPVELPTLEQTPVDLRPYEALLGGMR